MSKITGFTTCLIIVSIGLLGFQQNAFAVEVNSSISINSQESCENLEGSWSTVVFDFQCSLTNLTVGASGRLIVGLYDNSEIRLHTYETTTIRQGGYLDPGSGQWLNAGGTVNNHGTISVDTFSRESWCYGTINNYGSIDFSGAPFINYCNVVNHGSMSIYAGFTNEGDAGGSGTVKNTVDGTITISTGTLTNNSTVLNQGDLVNNLSGSIINNDQIINCGIYTGSETSPNPIEGGYTDNGVCTAATQCTVDQYESSALTDTTDRICDDVSDCEVGQFESEAPTAISDRVCSDVSDCEPGQFETAAPTDTADRMCADLTECLADEYESVPPNAVNDRVCAAARCGSGTIVVDTKCVADPAQVISCATGTTLNVVSNECIADIISCNGFESCPTN